MFSGFTFGAKVGKRADEPFDIGFKILGAVEELHERCNGRHGVPFELSPAAAQLSAYFIDGNRGKVWLITPDSNVGDLYADMSIRAQC